MFSRKWDALSKLQTRLVSAINHQALPDCRAHDCTELRCAVGDRVNLQPKLMQH